MQTKNSLSHSHVDKWLSPQAAYWERNLIFNWKSKPWATSTDRSIDLYLDTSHKQQGGTRHGAVPAGGLVRLKFTIAVRFQFAFLGHFTFCGRMGDFTFSLLLVFYTSPHTTETRILIDTPKSHAFAFTFVHSYENLCTFFAIFCWKL